MLDKSQYTVGWICAVVTEFIAARLFLDEQHETPQLAPGDENQYTLGRMGNHNVVIAVFPDGEYGIARAAGVAQTMVLSFPRIKIGLMVGIAGGAPRDQPGHKHDIRLGDVVVSSPRDGHGGVVQYKFGKDIGGKGLQTTGFLNQPPLVLRSALAGLKADYEQYGHQIQDNIERVLPKNRKRLHAYRRPAAESDRLYRPEVFHPIAPDAVDCEVACGNDPAKKVPRKPRDIDDDDPVVHYGLIASADTLMKNASERDRYAREMNVLCFEMEAAGLMNHFPCLVIRGICDYADTHKNKEWQGYAAMTAAAYAKDLLRKILPKTVEAEKRIADVLQSR
jgi:nucleoside phosphorylase